MVDSPPRRGSGSPSYRRAHSSSRSRSRSLPRRRYKSRSQSHGRSRSRSYDRLEATNEGNTLYVTGLSSRVTERGLEEHFSKEGKVGSCFLVVEPRTRISRGFAFVTMDSVEGANQCVRHLNQSILEGRYITVEKSRRKRPRTPTPGHYLGLKSNRNYYGGGYDRRRSGGGGYGRDDYYYYYSSRSPRRSDHHSPRHACYYDRRSPPTYYSSRRSRIRSRSPY